MRLTFTAERTTRRRFITTAAVGAGATVLAACQPATGNPPAGNVGSNAADRSAQRAAATTDQAAWEQLVAEARREGAVNVYAPTGDRTREALIDSFEAAHPGIKAEGTFGPAGTVIVPRLLTERTAGRYLADVVVHGAAAATGSLKPAGALAPLKPALLLDEVVDPSAWLGNRLWWADAQEPAVSLSFQGSLQASVVYNTQMVEAVQFTSYQDLLNPRWKGQIVMRDIRQGVGTGNVEAVFMYRHADLGPSFLDRLFGETNPNLAVDQRQMIDWLAQGRFPVGVFLNANDVRTAARDGLPVAVLPPSRLKEGAPIGAGSGSVALVDRAPHPNAAKLYVNWLLSRDGQLAWQRAIGQPSLRVDLPRDGLDPTNVPVPGVSYVDATTEDYNLLDGQDVRALVGQIMTTALERSGT